MIRIRETGKEARFILALATLKSTKSYSKNQSRMEFEIIPKSLMGEKPEIEAKSGGIRYFGRKRG